MGGGELPVLGLLEAAQREGRPGWGDAPERLLALEQPAGRQGLLRLDHVVEVLRDQDLRVRGARLMDVVLIAAAELHGPGAEEVEPMVVVAAFLVLCSGSAAQKLSMLFWALDTAGSGGITEVDIGAGIEPAVATIMAIAGVFRWEDAPKAPLQRLVAEANTLTRAILSQHFPRVSVFSKRDISRVLFYGAHQALASVTEDDEGGCGLKGAASGRRARSGVVGATDSGGRAERQNLSPASSSGALHDSLGTGKWDTEDQGGQRAQAVRRLSHIADESMRGLDSMSSPKGASSGGGGGGGAGGGTTSPSISEGKPPGLASMKGSDSGAVAYNREAAEVAAARAAASAMAAVDTSDEDDAEAMRAFGALMQDLGVRTLCLHMARIVVAIGVLGANASLYFFLVRRAHLTVEVSFAWVVLFNVLFGVVALVVTTRAMNKQNQDLLFRQLGALADPDKIDDVAPVVEGVAPEMAGVLGNVKGWMRKFRDRMGGGKKKSAATAQHVASGGTEMGGVGGVNGAGRAAVGITPGVTATPGPETHRRNRSKTMVLGALDTAMRPEATPAHSEARTGERTPFEQRLADNV